MRFMDGKEIIPVLNQTGGARDGKEMERVEMYGVNDDRGRGFNGLCRVGAEYDNVSTPEQRLAEDPGGMNRPENVSRKDWP